MDLIVLKWPSAPKRPWVYRISDPYTHLFPDSYSKGAGGNPRDFGHLYQQYIVVHYPMTVWKNSYTEHKVPGKTYIKYLS